MKKLTISEMNRISVAEYHAADKLPLVVVLDNVRSQHNIGAVFRTADAFRLERVCLCGISCCPPNREIHKTALGAEESVSWTYCEDTLQALHDLKEQGYKVYAVEQAEGSMTLVEAVQMLEKQVAEHTQSPLAIVLGHEVFGVRQEVVDAADGCIEIPQYGTKHSLNVSVTAGIVIYSLAQPLLKILNNKK